MKALDFDIDFNLVQAQKLLLTPQLKQALDILGMNSQELFRYVTEQLEINPVLDMAENEEQIIEDAHTPEDEDWEEEDAGEDEPQKPEAEKTVSLQEHLLLQLHASSLGGTETAIGEYFIDSIDENGYLTVDLSAAAAFFNVAAGKIQKVLGKLQTFDPPGIFARNVKECLLIQLKQMSCSDGDAYMIIERYLDALAAGKLLYIAKSTGLSVKKIKEVFELIKTLEPKPGREFYNNTNAKLVIPEIVVREINHKFNAIINEDTVPDININSRYRQLMDCELSEDAKKFIQNKISNALWLIKCIEQRKSILVGIAGCIIEEQQDFFRKGKGFLKPLAVKHAADRLNMHESIIEKAVFGKYLHCIWGTFELGSFFT